MKKQHGYKKIATLSIISVALMFQTFYLYTYSYFNENFFVNRNVKAAEYKDFIDEVMFQYSSHNETKTITNPEDIIVNPNKILIHKNSNLQDIPIIYFEVEGDIKKYGLHINPLKLDKDINEREININVNLNQFLDKLFNNTNDINGKIYIKYLNEYLNKAYDIKFTREYVINDFLEDAGIEKIETLNDFNAVNSLLKINTILDKYKNLKTEVSKSNNSEQIQNIITNSNELVNINNIKEDNSTLIGDEKEDTEVENNLIQDNKNDEKSESKSAETEDESSVKSEGEEVSDGTQPIKEDIVQQEKQPKVNIEDEQIKKMADNQSDLIDKDDIDISQIFTEEN